MRESLKVMEKGINSQLRVRRGVARLLAFCLLTLAFASCRQDMHDQPKYKPLRPMAPLGSINDGRSSRPLVEGTVARGHLNDDVELFTGKTAEGRPTPAGQAGATQPASQAGAAPSYQGFVIQFPLEIDREVLDRGQERYNIYCSVCHGSAGVGDGMVSRRGFKRPPSFHDERLRNAPVGYFFDVITNGFGAMPDYSSQIDARDRWAIISYVRALQLSRQGAIADVPAAEQQNLRRGSQQEGQK